MDDVTDLFKKLRGGVNSTLFLAFAATLSQATPARAEGLRLHVEAGAAKAIANAQRRETGWGGLGSVELEWRAARALGLQLGLGALALTDGDPPKNPDFADRGTTSAQFAVLGLRLYPFATAESGTASPSGFWLDVNGGAAHTDELVRPTVQARTGFDFFLSPVVALGPYAGYHHVFQPNDTLRPDDLSLVSFGIHVAFGRHSVEQPKQAKPLPAKVAKAEPPPPPPPPSDRDKDGILDELDKCPDEPEDRDGFEDEDGCPDYDNDADGIVDVADRCPNEPETKNGYADEDGCPDSQAIRVLGDKIVLDDRVHFDTNRATLRPESFRLLHRVAKLIEEHPEYVRVEVHGYCDERGTDEYNMKLSEARANSVVNALVKSGIAAERLSSKGFGRSEPLVEGSSEQAWRQNRRVEFAITREQKQVSHESSELGVAP